MDSRSDVYYTAPFSIDGYLTGIGSWRLTELSPKWLDACEKMLVSHGPTFRSSLEGMLSHIEVKLTSAAGAGLGMFFANRELVVSTAYLRGVNFKSEDDVLSMFTDSLARSPQVLQADSDDRPFEELRKITERPLHIVIAWANPNVSIEDEDLIVEFSNHFAAAYLCKYKG